MHYFRQAVFSLECSIDLSASLISLINGPMLHEPVNAAPTSTTSFPVTMSPFSLDDDFKYNNSLTIDFPFLVETQIKILFPQYIKKSNSLIKPIVKSEYFEFYEEMRGISDGAKKRGINISLDFIIAWNAFLSLWSYYLDGQKERCSAFIATGDATQNGDIIMTHNTHADFGISQFFNIILYVKPTIGIQFVMQTGPGLISSSADWFVCNNGIFGSETTISYINYKPKFGRPIFCRIRQAMQYGNTLDEYVDILLKGNAGDYACSWLFGDANTNEIMLFEIGLEKHNIQRTNNGIFYGMNSPISKTLREAETDDKDYSNINTSIGNRKKRFNYLLNDKYYGKININNAKIIISDHHDNSSNRTIMNSKTICKHTELDGNANQPFELVGSMDGKVINSSMAKNMSFLARFGSSCGKRNFDKSVFLKEHPEYKFLKDYITDFPSRKWTKIENNAF